MVLIEKEGIPAVCIVGSLLQRVAANVYRGAKFADLPLAVVPQDALTRAIADYRPVFEQSLDSIVFGLTAWRPQSQATGISPATPATFVYQGQDYADAMQQMNEAFLTNRWGDGLPLLPATKERVRWLLTGTDRAPDEMVAKVPPRGGIATPAAIAIVAAMAGCRPEYMPVLIAIVEAMADPRFQLAESSGTTHASTPTVVINGPIAKQIGINSSYGMLGPSAEYPAGASIGRAIRLLLTTLGGVIPGVTSVSVMAQPGRYTGLVFAEAEDLMPATWEPLSVERGFARGANTVSVFTVGGSINIVGHPDDHVAGTILSLSKVMGMPYENYWNAADEVGWLIVSPWAARTFAEAGWTKERLRRFFFEHATAQYTKSGFLEAGHRYRGEWAAWFEAAAAEAALPIALDPDKFTIVVAGGDHPRHSAWLPVGVGGQGKVTREIRLPANWDEVLRAAPKFWSER